MSVNSKVVRIPQTHSKMKSIVNLSYNKKDTITPNLIIPVMCERTIPGDVWNLKLTGFLRWLYLKVPSLDTLKLSLNVFYAEHIDLFQDAQSVIKGSGESEYDDKVEYNFPYVTNMLMPYYYLRCGQGNHKEYFHCTHSAKFYYNEAEASSVNPDFTRSVDSFLMLLTGGQDIQFSVLGEVKTIKFPYDVCRTIVWSNSYYSYITGATFEAPIVAGRAHIGGLYEKIFGVVGDAPKVVNAEPVILYYLTIDYYYRAQQHIKPFVGRIKGVDKTIDERMVDVVKQYGTDDTSSTTGTFFRIDNNFFMFNIIDTQGSEFHNKKNVFVDGCVCNTWDENQSCLSRFINGNRLQYNASDGTANVLENTDSSILYKLITYFNGGICPVLKHPDYFTMATIKPSFADPVNMPSVSFDNFRIVSAPNRIATGEITSSVSDLSSLPEHAILFKAAGLSGANADVITYFPNSSSISEQVSPLFPSNYSGSGAYQRAFVYDSGLGVSAEAGAYPTIVDLRRAALMQTYYEKINANGFLFQDYMLAFFGQDVEDEHLRIPRLIGRASATFDIIPVVQQSGKSSADGSPLGTLAGNAVANFSTGLIRFSCQMGGFVLANLSISGNNSYQEAYSRWCFERGSLDQYNPHFLGIGDQAIMNYELFNPAMMYNVLSYGTPNSIPSYDGKSSSEIRYVNQLQNVAYTNSSVVFNILDISSDGFKKAVNQAFKGFGFIPRRQELRTAFNKIGGNFKSRSDLISTINPSYSSVFATGNFRGGVDNARSGSILTNIGSLDVWTLSEDNDFENLHSVDFDVDLSSGTPKLTSAFLMACKPWQRLVEYNDVPPIYMSLNVIAHVVRTITAQSIQGQGVHL